MFRSESDSYGPTVTTRDERVDAIVSAAIYLVGLTEGSGHAAGGSPATAMAWHMLSRAVETHLDAIEGTTPRL